jgi:hypothetical protein
MSRLGYTDPLLPARTVLGILLHLPQIESGPFQVLSLRCSAKTTMFLGGIFQDHTLQSCFPIGPMI